MCVLLRKRSLTFVVDVHGEKKHLSGHEAFDMQLCSWGLAVGCMLSGSQTRFPLSSANNNWVQMITLLE